jgi:hypothetical protein
MAMEREKSMTTTILSCTNTSALPSVTSPIGTIIFWIVLRWAQAEGSVSRNRLADRILGEHRRFESAYVRG